MHCGLDGRADQAEGNARHAEEDIKVRFLSEMNDQLARVRR
ncbi:hypothetical protein ABT237_25160 [Streptomyces sp. NPDC001581]